MKVSSATTDTRFLRPQFLGMINTDYLPFLEEDAIENHEPSQWERWGHGKKLSGIDDVVKQDEKRFKELCKKYGFNYSKR